MTTKAKTPKQTTAERTLLTTILKSNEPYNGNVKFFASEMAKLFPDMRFSNPQKTTYGRGGTIMFSTTVSFQNTEYRICGLIDDAVSYSWSNRRVDSDQTRELRFIFHHGNIVGKNSITKASMWGTGDKEVKYKPGRENNVDLKTALEEFLSTTVVDLDQTITRRDAYKKRKAAAQQAAIIKKAQMRDTVFATYPELRNFKHAEDIFNEAYKRSPWEGKVKAFVKMIIDFSERT